MDTAELRSLLDLAIRAAREAGALARLHAGRPPGVDRKRDRADLVTAIDREVEQRIRAILLGAHPEHVFYGEESGGAAQQGGARWLVDPIDGTLNFVAGFPYYCVSIALELDGVLQLAALYDPERDELFTALRGQGARCNGAPIAVADTDELGQALLATGYSYKDDRAEVEALMARVTRLVGQARGVRRAGAAALDLANVACGRFAGFWEPSLNPWDVAAGWLLVEEAGGRVSDLTGQPFGYGATVVASNGRIHDQLLAALDG